MEKTVVLYPVFFQTSYFTSEILKTYEFDEIVRCHLQVYIFLQSKLCPRGPNCSANFRPRRLDLTALGFRAQIAQQCSDDARAAKAMAQSTDVEIFLMIGP